MKTLIIQPPLVQLNTPYPSGAYLSAFFRNLGFDTQWVDFSNGLFHELFCSKGLEKLFTLSQEEALSKAFKAEKKGKDEEAFQLRRYISNKDLWIRWIDPIVDIVCGRENQRELCHEFVQSPFIPRGMRMEQFLGSLERDVCVDDAQLLASLALADIGDYITSVFDSNFALIRYAEHLACSTSSFDSILENLKAPVLVHFFKPLLEKFFSNYLERLSSEEKILVCISIPFPGSFVGGLFAASFVRSVLGSSAIISIGGGYINTELREIQEKRVFDFVDYISYDRGYGSCLHLLSNLESHGALYKTAFLDKKGCICPPLEDIEQIDIYIKKEDEYTRSIVPDFSDIDFSLYPRLADDVNPMHRLWSDGAWLKAYLAHGCYWHRCAFCDTTLDYVCQYRMTDIKNLHKGLLEQGKKTGVYGVHFVDEASPPVALEQFALANSELPPTEKRLTFWGNIRFEKTFTRDLADLLSFAGLTGVSGGIEIATGEGLTSVNKGTDMEHLVAACAAFKEAGILVHGYMIYGFWEETPQILIDSMETLRQLFQGGLLDSAFWHKFVLTRHSTVFAEWEKGLHPQLKPILPKVKPFAENDLRFEGEEKSEKYGPSLQVALDAWMHGEGFKKKVEQWFDFPMPKTSLPLDYVDSLIAKYEENRDRAFSVQKENTRYVWLGGKLLVLPSGKNYQLCWSYMGEIIYFDFEGNGTEAQNFANSLWDLRPEQGKSTPLPAMPKKLFKALRGRGLCALLVNSIT